MYELEPIIAVTPRYWIGYDTVVPMSLRFLAVLTAFACARQSAAPQGATPPAPSGDPSTLQPPPLGPEEMRPTAPEDPRSARSELRRSIFVAAWTAVRDKHYDKTLGGTDWNALRAKYEPLAVGAPDEPTFYRLVNEMLGALGQSHLEVSGPGAHPLPTVDDPARAPPAGAQADNAALAGTDTGDGGGTGGDGDPGLVVRVIESRPTVTSVRPGSSAARAGLRPGFIVTHVGGRPLGSPPKTGRPLRPVEERFQVRLLVARQLSGPAGSRVTVRYLDNGDRPGEVVLERDPPRGRPVRFGWLPPLYPEVRTSQVGDVGIIAFNFFLLDPVLGEVQKAIDVFRSRGAKAIVLDLRGNPGGLGAMAIPVAARLVSRPLVLGSIQFREHTNTLTAQPSIGITPFSGRVILLCDEGTASTSEMLAAGLQEAGRAVVVGDTTLGAVLPSKIEALPAGAVIQLPVADFRTPKGILLEGRGVQPNRRVFETRAALRSNHDPVLEAGLAAARFSGAR